MFIFQTFHGEFVLLHRLMFYLLSVLSCWLAAQNEDEHFDFGKPMFWGFLVPVGLVLIYSVVLLVLVSLTTCRTDPNLNR